jgi:hypothetical protein
MKNFFLALLIIFLIIFTTLTKNSTKKLENKIFNIKENIIALENKHELVLLEYNFLTSPKKLLEYQSKYFENDLNTINIKKIKIIEEKNNKLKITELNNE